MKYPPFNLTIEILNQAGQIQEILGELSSYSLLKPSVKLRKENQIKTVHHSLAIEGNTLSEDQITKILEGKKVIGPQKQITEVQNALDLYNEISAYDPIKEKDLMLAHKQLMKNLIPQAGKYRNSGVGILKGTQVSHIAPPAKQVPHLVAQLFDFLKADNKIPWIIKACIFHYELEFIHPFVDGNGRMGRLWQQLILMKQSPIFEYLSIETLIHKKQKEYYSVLEECDKKGEATAFVEFSLRLILATLKKFKENYKPQKPKIDDRILHAIEFFDKKSFTRRDYILLHKGLSTATASRDLAKAVEDGLLNKQGDKSNTLYRKIK